MTKAKNGNVQAKPNFSIASVGENLADKGFEQMGAKDLALPFSLPVLLSRSPLR